MRWCFHCRRIVGAPDLKRPDCKCRHRAFEGYITEREEIAIRKIAARGKLVEYEYKRWLDK